jgi:hypothetical protein
LRDLILFCAMLVTPLRGGEDWSRIVRRQREFTPTPISRPVRPKRVQERTLCRMPDLYMLQAINYTAISCA